ncbi:rhomboid family intramembrane serine protease [Antrihabitans stalactiti]|uniref:Rhomboid family intramembrane serine protease n=1 Tax=Antrihabitans stalactiti TaxID=2584121 RepID=A0A848KTE4_9NOCA|nr:rhomboid family intramembrane serine protease [Antrihabitans stalactiti]NMN99450.1 rhomboid family intramembrane serine protease [Antrihabitans stalactiti]
MTGSLGPSFDQARIDALRASIASGSTVSTPASPEKPKSSSRALWRNAGITILAFTALLYAIEFIDVLDDNALDQDGIRPRTLDGLWGILWAPLLHYGWGHLIANTLPLIVLGFLALLAGIARGVAATGVIWLVAGVGTWLTGETNSVHLGASALIFGWLTFLITRGLFTRSLAQIAIGLVVLFVYGGLLWGVLPGAQGISWQGHLFGAIGGVIAAWVVSSRGSGAKKQNAIAA